MLFDVKGALAEVLRAEGAAQRSAIPAIPAIREVGIAGIAEIATDENLMRSELTPTQEAEHLAKRKELWEAKAMQKSGASCPTLTGRGNTAFASETAETTGVDKRTINRAVSRAEGVVEEVRDEIRGTDLDKGTVLTPAERALFTARRKEVYEALHPEARHGGATSNKDAKLASFAEDQAAKTGASKRTVQRDAERGQQVAEDVAANPDQPPAARYFRYSRYSPPPNSGNSRNSSQHVARLEAATPEPDRQDDARPDADGYCRTWTGRIVRLDEWRNLTAWDRHGPARRLFCGICKQWVSRGADCPQSGCWKGGAA